MLKKRSLLIVAVLGLLVLGTGVAYAADDQAPAGLRAAGKVTAIDLAANSFTLETLRKVELTVIVSESTGFRSRDGNIHGLEDLETGMSVGVAGRLNAEGELVADVVAFGNPRDLPARFQVRGEITGVAASDSSITLKTRDGKELEISLSDRTRFRSRDDSIQGIEDLEVGMLSKVSGLKGPDGQLNALLVAAGSDEDRPDIRMLGEITAIGNQSFTVENRQGRSLIFEVDESTHFRSRDGKVMSFGDLEIGMKVVVAGDEATGGTYKAILVGVGASTVVPEGGPPGPPPDGPGV